MKASRATSALVLCVAAPWPLPAAEPSPDGPATAPAEGEHRYRLSAAIRPLLFWIGAANVGGARIVWRSRWRGAARLRAAARLQTARAPSSHQPLGLGARTRTARARR